MQTNQRRIAYRIDQLVTTLCAVTIGIASTSAQANQTSPPNVVTGYGPGIAGQIIEGPTTPNRRPEIPCSRPFANATVLVLGDANGSTIGMAVTNERGNFLVSVPSGKYICACK